MTTTIWLAAFAAALIAQDVPQDPQGAGRNALEELKEIRRVMQRSEEALHGASLGRGVLDQEEILKRLEDLEKDPERLQAQVLKLIDKLLEKSAQDQEETIRRITELIKKAKQQQGGSQQPQQNQPQDQQQPGQQQGSKSSGPAQSPYQPDRSDPPSKFRSEPDRHGEWGNLPPRERDAMLHERRAIDQFPLEYQEMLKEYWEGILRGGN